MARLLSFRYAYFQSGRFGLSRFGPADSVWPIHLSRLGLGRFCLVTFRSGPFQSGDISVWAVSVCGPFGQTMKSFRSLTCSHFNTKIPKSTRSFIWI